MAKTNGKKPKEPTSRDEAGRFMKGSSGNPVGRISVLGPLRDMARNYTTEALETILGIMLDVEAPQAARLKAADMVLDRAYGKVPQAITDADGGSLTMGENGLSYEDVRRILFALKLREVEQQGDVIESH